MGYTIYNIYAICAFAAIGKLLPTTRLRSFSIVNQHVYLPGGGLFGFDISSMSGVLGTEAYKNYFGKRKLPHHSPSLFYLRL